MQPTQQKADYMQRDTAESRPIQGRRHSPATAHVRRLLAGLTLRPSEERVLFALAEAMPSGCHYVVAGQRWLMAVTRLSRPTVQRAIAALVDLGLIKTVFRYDGAGKRTHSSIEIVGLQEMFHNRKETARTKPHTRHHTRHHTRPQNDAAPFNKGRSSTHTRTFAQGAPTEVACQEDDLIHPVTGELLVVVGGCQ